MLLSAADALSRAPFFHTAGSESSSKSASVAEVLVVDPSATVSAPIAVSVTTSTHSPEFSLESIVRAQQDDPYCQKLTSELRDDVSSDSPSPFFLDGSCLRYRYVDSSGSYTPVVLPTIFQQRALAETHHSPVSGHLGLRKTLAILQRQFYWPRLKADARRFVLTCHVCQVSKRRGPNPRFGSLHPIEYEFPMHTVSIDVVGPISPVSAKGNRYIFVVVDNFTNHIWLFATPDETSGTTAQILLNLFLAYGFPVRLLSDRGSNFLSALVEELLRLLRVASVTTTSYHPRTDGKNEVSHRMLLSQIRAFVSKDNRADSDSLLPFFAFAANSTARSPGLHVVTMRLARVPSELVTLSYCTLPRLFAVCRLSS